MELVSIIIAAVALIITAIYNFCSLKQTRKIIRDNYNPDIQIYFDHSELESSFLYINIENKGFGKAKNTTFEVVENFDLYENDKFNIASKGIIKNGIANFYPHQKFRYFFTDLSQNNKGKIEQKLRIKVIYKDIFGKANAETFNLKLNEVIGIGKTNPPDDVLQRIPYELIKIRKLLESITSINKGKTI